MIAASRIGVRGMNIGFIGLGQMGHGMAVRLIECGHQLTVWNRTQAAAAELGERGARVVPAPAQTFENDVVISMLADDAAVDSVWVSSNLAAQMNSDVLHLNMASVSLAMGKRLEALHAGGGSSYVAAPVFGRRALRMH
jgi:3-hydroxyisobutyrate dehydrogenase-like beta-hydroxyacid dehydrogenase